MGGATDWEKNFKKKIYGQHRNGWRDETFCIRFATKLEFPCVAPNVIFWDALQCVSLYFASNLTLKNQVTSKTPNTNPNYRYPKHKIN